jgi:outer membrane protein OmpU
MDKFKKIGLSALAGSLATFAVNAGEMAVTGGAEVTFHNDSGSGDSTGNPFGMGHTLTFTGSGELDGGQAFTYMTAINDTSSGIASSKLTVDLGDLGTIGFDQGTGLGHMGGIDDMTPSAYEESWHGLSTGLTGVGSTGSTNALNYKSPNIAGFVFNVNYVNQTGGGNNTDDANSGATTTTTVLRGSGTDIIFSYSGDMVPGLTLGGGQGTVKSTTTAAGDENEYTLYAKYAMGPVTAGYQWFDNRTEKSTEGTEGTMWGVSFNVNDNLSVSYNESETEYLKSGYNNGAHVTQENEGISIAYTMGSMAVKAVNTEGTNVGGTAGTTDELTEVSVSLTF